MSQLLKKQPTKIVQKTDMKSVQNKPEKPVQSPPKEQECAGWCGEVFPASQLKDYRKKLYCPSCYSLKMDEVDKAKAKPAGLTEDAIRSVIDTKLDESLKSVNKYIEWSNNEIVTLKKLLKESSPDLPLRDLVVAAKTIFVHLAGLERFTSKRMNGRQGDDMRAWLVQADKILGVEPK